MSAIKRLRQAYRYFIGAQTVNSFEIAEALDCSADKRTATGSRLLIFRQTFPETPKPYRIVESFLSVDGCRWRVADGAWPTAEHALIARQALIDQSWNTGEN